MLSSRWLWAVSLLKDCFSFVTLLKVKQWAAISACASQSYLRELQRAGLALQLPWEAPCSPVGFLLPFSIRMSPKSGSSALSLSYKFHLRLCLQRTQPWPCGFNKAYFGKSCSHLLQIFNESLDHMCAKYEENEETKFTPVLTEFIF